MLAQFVQSEVYFYIMVFVRIGAAMMLLPGFGEVYVAARARLAIALLIALAATPLVRDTLPPPTSIPLKLGVLVITEAVIGLYIGAVIRMLLAALHTAGTVIAFQTGMGAAMMFDPNQGGQSAMPGNFLTVLALTLILVTDLHHHMIAAVIDSYRVFPPGNILPVEGFARMGAQMVSDTFRIAVQMSAPLLVTGLVFYILLGLLARLMPTMQVFFIAIPAQVLIGFLVLALCLSAMMLWYLGFYESRVAALMML